MKAIFIVFIITIIGLQTVFAQAPVINSFSPLAGLPGTLVTITGYNFSSIPADNTVFFGAVKASVLSASSNQVMVSVPAGATFQPLSITVNNLTAYAARPFIVTFPGGGYTLSPYTFYNQTSYVTGGFPAYASVSDLNGDGKPDFVIANRTNNTVTIHKNNTINNSFAASISSSLSAGPGLYAAEIADMDGDGKRDVLAVNINSGLAGSINIFRNTTSNTVDSISFATGLTLASGNGTTAVKATDLNADGKTDMVAVGSNASYFSVFRNIGTSSNLAFAPRLDFNFAGRGNDLALIDIDSNGKPDVVIVNADYPTSAISICRNISNGDSIAFAPKVDFPTGSYPSGIVAGDLNADGKPDIAFVNYSGNTLTLYQNQSTIASVLLANRVDIAIDKLPRTINMGDVDGDGKPDLIVSYADTSGAVSIFRNVSPPGGALSFETRRNYKTGNYQTYSVIADLNLDGRPDILVTNTQQNNVTVLKNRINDTIPVSLCPPLGSETIVNVQAANTYQWQIDTGSVFVNISNNANYSGANTASLQLNNIPSSWRGYRFRCLADGNYSETFSIVFTNTWKTGTNNAAWENPANWLCGTVPDANTDVIISRGNVLLSSDATIRSLTISPNSVLRVATGKMLTVLH